MRLKPKQTLAFTISRAASPDRLARLTGTLINGADTAGASLDWLLWANSPEAAKRGADLGMRVLGTGANVGQHLAFAEVLKLAAAEGYEYLLRVDDDADFLTRNWLRKLIDVSEEIRKLKGRPVILAPRVSGLKNPIDIHGVMPTSKGDVQFVRITGGVCRLMPVVALRAYTPDVRQAMGAGEATGLSAYSTEVVVPMFVVPWVRVKHNTVSQESSDPDYFAAHKLYQHIPYIPPYVEQEVSGGA